METKDLFEFFHHAVSQYYHWYIKGPDNERLSLADNLPKQISDPLDKYGKEICEILIGSVSNKHDRFSIELFSPYPLDFGGTFKIKGEQTKTDIELCISYDGYELKLEPLFWEEIRGVGIQFFHYLYEASEGSKFLYEPNQGNEDAIEKEFSLSFRKVTNPIYQMIRDIVLMNDHRMESFNLVVRFDSFDDMSKNATKAFKNLYAANYLLYRKAYLRQHPKNKRKQN